MYTQSVKRVTIETWGVTDSHYLLVYRPSFKLSIQYLGGTTTSRSMYRKLKSL
jgi:hypothetical protein